MIDRHGDEEAPGEPVVWRSASTDGCAFEIRYHPDGRAELRLRLSRSVPIGYEIVVRLSADEAAGMRNPDPRSAGAAPRKRGGNDGNGERE